MSSISENSSQLVCWSLLYETPRIDRANPSRDMLLDAFF